MPRFDDTTVRSILASKEGAAIGEHDTTLSRDRELALRRYRGQPQGDERAGQSRIVMTDTQDSVEAVLPSLLRIFLSSSKGVEFEPENKDDEAMAKQATDYINFLFTRDNDGFGIFYTAFKDALLFRTGLIKVWWESGEEVVKENIEGIDETQLSILVNDPSVEIIEQTQRVEDMDGSGDFQPVFDVRYERVKNKGGRLNIEPIPPEEFVIDREAKNLKDYYHAHITFKTEGELISEIDSYQGVTLKDIKNLPSGTGFISTSEKTERFREEDGLIGNPLTTDTSTRLIRVAEHYIQMDYDDDGIAEWRIITTFGNNNETIAQNNPLPDGSPIIDFAINRMPHKFLGRSLDDQVKDIGEIKTAVVRQMLNNFYQSNFPLRIVDPNHINVDDLLSPSPNGVVRGNPAGYAQLPPTTLGSSPFNLLEYLETVKENRTGITRTNQGLEADTLNKTATGISLLLSASQQRQELMVRLLAESVKRMYVLMLKTVSRNQDIPRVIRLRNEWVTVDPRLWNSDMDASISVGLGSGSREQQVGALLNIKNMQSEALQMQQAFGIEMVTPEQIYNANARIVETSGFQDPTDFFIDQSKQEGGTSTGPQTFTAAEAQAPQGQGQGRGNGAIPPGAGGVPQEALEQAIQELENEGVPTQ